MRHKTNSRNQFLLSIFRILNAKKFFDFPTNFQQNEVYRYGDLLPSKKLYPRANYNFKIDFCLRLIVDIGANLTDGMFRGIYNGSQKHPNDLDTVLKRSWTTGLEKIIITVGTITDIDEAAKIAQTDGI